MSGEEKKGCAYGWLNREKIETLQTQQLRLIELTDKIRNRLPAWLSVSLGILGVVIGWLIKAL